MRTAVVLIAATWAGWWFTPDQRGQRLFRQGKYAQAAEAFQDPVWQGTAWYRAMEFKKAARSFARRSSPEARFNEGNAWLLMGKYDIAIANYDKALAKRPDWSEARENRDLAVARKKKLHSPGGDAGDQRLGARSSSTAKGNNPAVRRRRSPARRRSPTPRSRQSGCGRYKRSRPTF